MAKKVEYLGLASLYPCGVVEGTFFVHGHDGTVQRGWDADPDASDEFPAHIYKVGNVVYAATSRLQENQVEEHFQRLLDKALKKGT